MMIFQRLGGTGHRRCMHYRHGEHTERTPLDREREEQGFEGVQR